MLRSLEPLCLLLTCLALALLGWVGPESSAGTGGGLARADIASDALVASGDEAPLEGSDSDPGPASPDEEPTDDSDPDPNDDSDENTNFPERSDAMHAFSAGERLEIALAGLRQSSGTLRRQFRPPRA